MSNWAENPIHQRSEIEKHALPFLMYYECPTNCINDLTKQSYSESELYCLSNCQNKTKRAFDMMLGMQQRWAARKTFRDYVDISKYTGMEVENKHDTANVIDHSG